MPDDTTTLREMHTADRRRSLGSRGESLAARFLEANGYRLVLSNFKAAIGRNFNGAEVTGEIDIIAFDGDTLCFIEVKTRVSDEYTSPLSAIDLRKQRQIARAARVYRSIFGIRDVPVRYDAVSVLMPPAGKPRVSLRKGYWSEASLRKKQWRDDL